MPGAYSATSVAETGRVERRPSVGNDARLHRVAGPHHDGRRLMSRSPLGRGSHGAAALALVFLTASFAGHADAEIAVDGGRDEMRVRVENDTVGHVLEALRENGIFSYRSATPLTKVIGGSFSGSLGQVVSRILTGFDFVVTYRPQGAEIFIVGESGAKPIPPPTDAPQPQPESKVAEKAPPDINLAPRHFVPRAPSPYDRATSNLSMRR
jgi:hypothetical protein